MRQEGCHYKTNIPYLNWIRSLFSEKVFFMCIWNPWWPTWSIFEWYLELIWQLLSHTTTIREWLGFEMSKFNEKFVTSISDFQLILVSFKPRVQTLWIVIFLPDNIHCTINRLIFGILMPLSAIFQLFHGQTINRSLSWIDFKWTQVYR